MELLGIGLGVTTAILWGSADTIATMAARRLGTFKTTFVSQSAGFLALFSCGIVVYVFLHLPFPQTTVALSVLIGIFTGVCAALGYFYFYRALEAGPIALVSPLTSTSSVCTLLLSLFILRQGLTAVQIGAVLISILGVFLASTNPHEIRSLLQTPGATFFSQGVRWAMIATLAFGVMDFGIGASAAVSGWFLPVLWTRIFSICSLTLISYWKRRQRVKRYQMAATTQPHLGEAESSAMITGITPALSGASPLGNLGGILAVDPDPTVTARSSRRQGPYASFDPEATLVPRTSTSFDPEATLVPHSSRRLDTLALTSRSSSTLKLLEASLKDTFVIRPFRSYSTLLTLTGHTSPLRQMEPSDLDTMELFHGAAPLDLLSVREALVSDPAQRTLSLSLPSLEELSLLRRPLASMLGLGVLLAIIAGVAENAAVLCFSMDTRVATTGIASAIASGYSLIVILFGLSVYRERLTRNQMGGIILFLSGLVLLALIK